MVASMNLAAILTPATQIGLWLTVAYAAWVAIRSIRE